VAYIQEGCIALSLHRPIWRQCPYTGMVVLYYDHKSGFSAVISPNVDRSVWNLAGICWQGIHLWVQFNHNRRMGVPRPNVENLVFFW